MHEGLARCAARGVGQRARPTRFQAGPGSGQEGVEGEVLQPRILVGSSRAAQSQGERLPLIIIINITRRRFFVVIVSSFTAGREILQQFTVQQSS